MILNALVFYGGYFLAVAFATLLLFYVSERRTLRRRASEATDYLLTDLAVPDEVYEDFTARPGVLYVVGPACEVIDGCALVPAWRERNGRGAA